MTKTIKVMFGDEDIDYSNNINLRASFNWRYKYFLRIMEKSVLYWEILECYDRYDEDKWGYLIYINEFYMGIVLDWLNFDDFNSDAEWRDWFCKKYKIEAA